MTDDDAGIRSSAAWSIGWAASPLFEGVQSDAAEALLKLAGDKQSSVRTSALIGMAHWGLLGHPEQVSDDLQVRLHKVVIRIGESDPLVETHWVDDAVRGLHIKPTKKLELILAADSAKRRDLERQMKEARTRTKDDAEQ